MFNFSNRNMFTGLSQMINIFNKLYEYFNTFYKESLVFRRSGKGRDDFLTEKQIKSEKDAMRIVRIRQRLTKFEKEYICFLNAHCDERIDYNLHHVKPISIDKTNYTTSPGGFYSVPCLKFRAHCVFCGQGVSFFAPEVSESLDNDKKYFEEWFKSEGYNVKTEEDNLNEK